MLDKHDLEQIRQLNQESENRMVALMEGYFDPKFNLLLDKLSLIDERKSSVEVTQDLDERVTYLERMVESNTRDILRMKHRPNS